MNKIAVLALIILCGVSSAWAAPEAGRIKQIIAQQLGKDASKVTEGAYLDDLRADELDMIEMCMALEEEYNVYIPDEQRNSFKTVGQIVDFLTKGTSSASSSLPACSHQVVPLDRWPVEEGLPAGFKPNAKVAGLLQPPLFSRSKKFSVIIFASPGLPCLDPFKDWKAALKDYDDLRVQLVSPRSSDEAKSYGIRQYPTVLFYRGAELMKAVEAMEQQVDGKRVSLNDASGFLVPTLSGMGLPKPYRARKREAKKAYKDAKQALKDFLKWQEVFERTDRGNMGLVEIIYAKGSPEHREIADIQAQGRQRGAERQKQLEQEVERRRQALEQLKRER